MAHAWFPKGIDPDLIPAIRSLGKRGISVIDGDDRLLGIRSARFSFTDKRPFTLKELKAKKLIAKELLLSLAAVLANGPKIFVIPEDMIDDLNQIDIPLKVRDYSQPFPAVIVKSGDEYHLVWVADGRLMCLVENSGIVDFTVFLNLDAAVEENLSNSTGLTSVQMSDSRWASWVEKSDCWSPHRFRATLNFLLLVTAGGFVTDVRASKKVKRNRNKQKTKYTTPQTFVPQDIALWRRRLIDANHRGDSDVAGSKKTPHWRRTHWRRVAVGAGRTHRELRLIAACLVNKQRLNDSSDPADSEYVCQ